MGSHERRRRIQHSGGVNSKYTHTQVMCRRSICWGGSGQLSSAVCRVRRWRWPPDNADSWDTSPDIASRARLVTSDQWPHTILVPAFHPHQHQCQGRGWTLEGDPWPCQCHCVSAPRHCSKRCHKAISPVLPNIMFNKEFTEYCRHHTCSHGAEMAR